jgi:D-alanyl-D-alanine carboxypeptidase
MRIYNRAVCLVIFSLVLILCLGHGGLYADNDPATELAKKIDAFLEKIYPANEPGAAVLAMQGDNIILRKGYGMANLELGVPIQPDMVFRLGSITKQFTAVAIMKLAEEGKISVDDDIHNYLPDFPTHGQKVTIRHLLNHTSGIKSYTSMPEWRPLMRKDMALTELIDLFKNQPMDFTPGEGFLYNNSGYILLGAIIEKVSGQRYEEYISEKIFQPLGMRSSYYGSSWRIIPRRVSGYDQAEDRIINASYLSMTQPYAAGSLLSTVDDLQRWYHALETGKVISAQSLEQMYKPTILNNGQTENYGYGWGLGTLFGEKIIEHGGGINGFSTDALRMPEKEILVVVLTNCPWRQTQERYVAQWIAAAICGKLPEEKKAVSLEKRILDALVGTYKIAEGDFRKIRLEGNQLFTQRGPGQKLEVYAVSETEFYYKTSFDRFSIVKDKEGNVIKMIMHRPGSDEEAIKVPDKPAADKKEK